MATFVRGTTCVNERAGKKECAAFAHLLRPNRGASPSANSRMGKSFDCFLSRRGCDGGHEQACVSRGHQADARRGKARSRSLRIVAARGCRSWLRRKKDRGPANGDSTPRISVSRTKLCRRGGRMALCASMPFDRQKRSARHAPRLREFLETISKRDANHRRRGAIARPTSRFGARAKDRSWRFVQRFHFTGAAARYLLCVAHFPASEL